MRTLPSSFILSFVLTLAACGDYKLPTSHQPITDPAQLYMALTLDHGAINLSTVAPNNTIQLTATPRNSLGEPLTGLPAPTFRSSQPLRVRVSHDGRVEALQTGTGILVIAELAVEGNTRQADTARINVIANAAPPLLDRLELDLAPPDSAVRGMLPTVRTFQGLLQAAGVSTVATVVARGLDPVGTAIPGLAIEHQSLDPSVVSYGSSGGVVTVLSPGQARIVARTTAYGVTKSDTVTFTVTLPVFQGITLGVAGPTTAVFPSEVTVLRNGWVFWQNNTGQPADVTFDDPTNVAEATSICTSPAHVTRPFLCGAGNIPAFDDVQFMDFRMRQFPVPGTYTYRNTVTGATGRIVVTDG